MKPTLPHEVWRDGKVGPYFELSIPSSSRSEVVYKVARIADGEIIHQPACEAFRHGHHECRHVREALRRAEEPRDAFMRDLAAMMFGGVERLEGESRTQHMARLYGHVAELYRRYEAAAARLDEASTRAAHGDDEVDEAALADAALAEFGGAR